MGLYTSVTGNEVGPLNRIGNAVRNHWFSYLLFVPTLVFLLIMVWLPFIRGIWMSFHNWPAFAPHEWIGLSNYKYLFDIHLFYVSLKATAIYMSMTVIQFALALGASLAARTLGQIRGLADWIFLIPYTMPPVVTGTIWLYILNPNFGPIFGWLVDWGILSEPIYWNTDGTTALIVVTLTGAWTFWQLIYIIFAASLAGIPQEYYETAKVYGANRWQRFWNITLPHLRGAILIAVSLRIIRNLMKVSQPLQMTQGGPGFSTSVLGILLYRFTLNRRQYGLAFTIGVILFVIGMALSYVFIREFRRQRTEGGI
jgi:ABC-type sugar transport system permease subunit